MKTLTFGDLKIELDLSPEAEDILIYEIKKTIPVCRRLTEHQRKSGTDPSILNETGSKGIITPKKKKNSKSGDVKK